MALWWLSFADETHFLGAMIVDAATMEAAVVSAHRAGTNPGGAVMGSEIPAQTHPPRTFEEAMALALLPRLTLFSRDALTQRGIFTEQVACDDEDDAWIQ